MRLRASLSFRSGVCGVFFDEDVQNHHAKSDQDVLMPTLTLNFAEDGLLKHSARRVMLRRPTFAFFQREPEASGLHDG